MALPDKPADLFGSVPTQPRPSGPASLQHLGYTISYEPMDDGTAPPELQPQLADLAEVSHNRPDRALAERLRKLVQQYPGVPVLKNYLTMAYVQTNQTSRANEVLEQTLKQHPRYLMGLINKANQLLLRDENTEAVDQLLGGPPTSLAQLYPERSVFHVSEVAHFSFTAFTYHLTKHDPDAALEQLRMMRDLDYHDVAQLRSLKKRLDLVRLADNMVNMQEGFANAITVDGYFRAEGQQTDQPPVFENPEIQWLYEHGLEAADNPLPADKRDALLTLPRPSLTADLSTVLLDIVYRYEHFLEQDWDAQHHNFASHALLLATELRADECLPAVLETLRQDGEFREFWWGDYLNEFYEPYFRRLLPDQANVMRAFMQEPDINTYAKVLVSEAYMQEALSNPALKADAQTWYSDVLTYLLDHADDEHLLDTDVIAFVIGDITDLQLTELLPLIRDAYARDLVTENIEGDLAHIEAEMVSPRFPPFRHPLRPIAGEYEYLRDPAAYRKAHPDPVREKASEDFIREMEARENEWAFLYEGEDDEDDDEYDEYEEMESGDRFPLFPPGKPASYQPQKPVVKEYTPGRNDKVSVRYPDGKVVADVKYKKVEADVQAGRCELV